MHEFPEVEIDCEFCGAPHKELVIDGHISKPHLCAKCWKQTLELWERRQDNLNCSTCTRCTYVHEYEMYFCEEHKQPIFGSLICGGCGSYEEYEEDE